ncbi:50S ribosomal protein L19e [Candidatus Woesearchaeota archaeon]|nr:MAG: 50S ribosomal protein L19e [Candidatus Woesearchaeota archaeon]
MKLTVQKRLAAQLLKCSEHRVVFNPERLEEIKEAITKADIKGLISGGVIKERPVIGNCRVRANKRKVQKSKGRLAGQGRRKGTKTARLPSKEQWMAKVRVQRVFLKELKDKGFLTTQAYRNLYMKVKSGFFRNKRHIKLYIDEKGLIAKKQDSKKK